MGSRSGERKFRNRLLEKEEFHDVCILSVLWIAKYADFGRQKSVYPSLSSFKLAWKALGFSHMYHAKPKNSTFEAFMQRLYNVCIMIPSLDMGEGDLEQLLHELKENCYVDVAHVEDIEQKWKDFSQVIALYCLFCIFEAQPRDPCVLIRIQEEQYENFRGLFCLMKHGHEDTKQALAKLWAENAFSFGVSYLSKSVSIEKQYHPAGAGSISLTAGLDPIDAVTLRESRYHLDSTLRGLGTQYVESLCFEYKNALSNVMIDKRLDDTPESYNLKGIADLNFGYEIHRNVLLASDRIRYSLYGREYGVKSRKQSKSIGSKKPKVQISKSLAGANAVLEREQARARDISHRKRCMERNIGLVHRNREEKQKSSSDDDSDMPDLWDSLPLSPSMHTGMLDSE